MLKPDWNPNTGTDNRANQLQEEFNETMPCKLCSINDVCKHCNTIHRINYDPEVFSIEVQCKIKDKYDKIKLEEKK